MSINMKGIRANNNGAGGIRLVGDHGEVTMEDVETHDNLGLGIDIQTVDVSKLDEETKQLLQDLKIAIEQKSVSNIKKTFMFIADKSVDLAIALIAGKLVQ